MEVRLRALQRIALVYLAVENAHALSLEQAGAALREAELRIERQKDLVRRSTFVGRVALDAGDHLDWQMHESQKQFTEWNTEGLIALSVKREAAMLEAMEVYRASRLDLEQIESVLRELRSELHLEVGRREQREADDRFLARQWWDARDIARTDPEGEGDLARMKDG